MHAAAAAAAAAAVAIIVAKAWQAIVLSLAVENCCFCLNRDSSEICPHLNLFSPNVCQLVRLGLHYMVIL